MNPERFKQITTPKRLETGTATILLNKIEWADCKNLWSYREITHKKITELKLGKLKSCDIDSAFIECPNGDRRLTVRYSRLVEDTNGKDVERQRKVEAEVRQQGAEKPKQEEWDSWPELHGR